MHSLFRATNFAGNTLKNVRQIVFGPSWCRSITSTPFPEFADLKHLRSHEDLHKYSLDNPTEFWGRLARSRLQWDQDFQTVFDCCMKEGKFKWFMEGKLNASVNCVDRHLPTLGDQVALIWEKDEPGVEEFITYRQLHEMVGKVANTLKNSGIAKGDCVAIYLPMSPITIATMLACARIGAVHNVVFAGFSATALASRIQDAQAKAVVTADQGVRGGRVIQLKEAVDTAVASCPSVNHVFVYQRTGADVRMGPKDVSLEKAMEAESSECRPVPVSSEDMLFMLYTSGSTGKPKGIAHSVAGYLLYAATTFKHVFDYQQGERFGCVADIGWITGHSYVLYGPLCNGATTLLFESSPIYPDPGRYWETVERLKLNHIYLAPTSLRLLLKSGDAWVNKYDLSSLRKLGCVGEPLNHEAWEWYNEVVGKKRCDIVDTWWQTETGGICITPRPSSPGAEIIPGMPMRPFFGIDPVLMDENNEEVKGEEGYGALCIRSMWPGMARTIYGDHQRFLDTYFKPSPGMYYTGDGAHRLPGGYYQITGRMDDVVNVTGHRLGTAEVEDVLDDHPDVAESAVVGFPHDVKGEGIFAFVVLKEEQHETQDEIKADLKATIKQRIASYAQPDHILITPNLPKTRSGKIMRRILRKIAANQPDELGDVTTLADPSVVEDIVRSYKKYTKSDD
ncbi:acetyl-coenzyme A synthetase 2-like, mitochondrial isoform X2 [Babylonia areolata]|uniref:acetyl-coenzyme A synthetase 2-like, mitochondrial isoform X2 n=1 Tax=Babylonia areolata TaxID=304850 RepID=UPI003FD4EA68